MICFTMLLFRILPMVAMTIRFKPRSSTKVLTAARENHERIYETRLPHIEAFIWVFRTFGWLNVHYDDLYWPPIPPTWFGMSRSKILRPQKYTSRHLDCVNWTTVCYEINHSSFSCFRGSGDIEEGKTPSLTKECKSKPPNHDLGPYALQSWYLASRYWVLVFCVAGSLTIV